MTQDASISIAGVRLKNPVIAGEPALARQASLRVLGLNVGTPYASQVAASTVAAELLLSCRTRRPARTTPFLWMDFSLKPGWVLNADDYPMPSAS